MSKLPSSHHSTRKMRTVLKATAAELLRAVAGGEAAQDLAHGFLRGWWHDRTVRAARTYAFATGCAS
jgi:hypothetical protein